MPTIIADIKHAVRMFWKAPSFSLAAVFTLALGIGVNVAVFSLLHATLLASLPVREPHRLVQVVTWTARGGDHFDFSYPLYVDIRDGADALNGLAAYVTGTVGISANGHSERVVGEFVTANYFQLLGVELAAGPGLTAADERPGSARVAVISDALWRSMFSADPATIGRNVTLNGETFTIVGVAPRGFDGIVRGQRAALWATVSEFFPVRNRPDIFNERTTSWLSLIGRLRDDVSRPQGQDRMTALVRRADSRTVAEDYSVRLLDAGSGDRALVENLDTPLNLLMATVGLILLIACANVANLLLARTYARQMELAVRQALGATRGRIVRQLLSETLVLSAVAGSIGLLLAFWVVDLFELRTRDTVSALALSIGPRWQVLLFAVLASLAAALASGLLPAVGTSRRDLIEIIKLSGAAGGGTPRRRRMRAALAVLQIALSLVLLIGGGLFLRSLWRLRSIEPSLATDRVIAAALNVTLRGYDQRRGQQFYESLLARVASAPGIEAATISSVLPVTAGGSRINVDARSTDPPLDAPFEADMIAVTAGYFQTLGVPLIAGRDFGPADVANGLRVMVINETLKQRVWGNVDPVGRTFSFGPDDTFVVVGVARDTKYRNLREAPRSTMYLPMAQSVLPGCQSRGEDGAAGG